MAATRKKVSKDALYDAAKKKVWADFAKLGWDAQAKRVVLETKRRLKALGCGHLSVRRGRGTAGGRVSIQRRDALEMLSPKEMIAIAEVLDVSPRSRTNSISMSFTEAQMRLGLRSKKPICSWCSTIYKTEREALDCLSRH